MTPLASAYHAPDQPSRDVDTLGADATGIDFGGVFHAFAVSGRVRFGGGAAAVGARVVLAGAQADQADIAAPATYAFNDLAAGSNYTVTPSLVYHTFAPANLPFAPLAANQLNQDFTATRDQFNIGGNVIDFQGNPVGGWTVDLAGHAVAQVMAPAANYQFANRDAGHDYSVTCTPAAGICVPALYRAEPLRQHEANWHFKIGEIRAGAYLDIDERPAGYSRLVYMNQEMRANLAGARGADHAPSEATLFEAADQAAQGLASHHTEASPDGLKHIHLFRIKANDQLLVMVLRNDDAPAYGQWRTMITCYRVTSQQQAMTQLNANNNAVLYQQRLMALPTVEAF